MVWPLLNDKYGNFDSPNKTCQLFAISNMNIILAVLKRSYIEKYINVLLFIL